MTRSIEVVRLLRYKSNTVMDLCRRILPGVGCVALVTSVAVRAATIFCMAEVSGKVNVLCPICGVG